MTAMWLPPARHPAQHCREGGALAAASGTAASANPTEAGQYAGGCTCWLAERPSASTEAPLEPAPGCGSDGQFSELAEGCGPACVLERCQAWLRAQVCCLEAYGELGLNPDPDMSHGTWTGPVGPCVLEAAAGWGLQSRCTWYAFGC